MKAYYISLFLFFMVVGCYAEPGNPNMPKESQLNKNADPYSWDFGTVKEGAILKHIFILKNEAQNLLNIKDVNTSCGCTVSKVAKKVLAPAEETSIEVKFDTKGYSGPTQQFVYVHTDDLDNPIVRYIIKADVTK